MEMLLTADIRLTFQYVVLNVRTILFSRVIHCAGRKIGEIGGDESGSQSPRRFKTKVKIF
jgi:hypothetical protein